MNPFQRLTHLYGISLMEKYKGTALGELKPHPFAIADLAYRSMMCFIPSTEDWYYVISYNPYIVLYFKADI